MLMDCMKPLCLPIGSCKIRPRKWM